MTFAPRDILRKIPTGPNPPPSDLMTLLGSKLRVFFDVRFGGTFGAGVWSKHRDMVTGLELAAVNDAGRPLCELDGTNFRGVRPIRISSAPDRKLVNAAISNVVPIGSRPEVFCVARMVSFAAINQICGVASSGASLGSGAQAYVNSNISIGVAVGNNGANANFNDTTAPHLWGGFNDGTNAHVYVDGNILSSTARTATTLPTQQACVGGFATGFTGSADAYVAAWGVVNPPMTTEERAIALSILRNDWGF